MTQVLVVEDEGIVALDIQEQLTGLGYAVSGQAASGREAIEKMAACQPDVVLMDIRLKGDSDGIDIAHEIREQFNIPIIYITASNDEETLERAIAAEPFGYLVKPVEAKTLHAAIEIALHKHKVEGTLRKSYEELRRQVEDQVIELSRTNKVLRQEIADRKQAESAEQEQHTLVEALLDTTAALHSTLDAEKVMRVILENVGRVVPYETANIMLIESDVGYIACSQAYAKHEILELQTPSFPIAEIPNLQQMVTSAQPCVIPDVQNYPGWVDSQYATWLRSYAGAPICLDGKVIGFLNLESSTPNFYTSAHAERLQVFADQVALAVRNAKLFEDERRERLTSQTLQKTAEALVSAVNLEDVLERVIDLLREIVDYNYATVMLLETTMLRVVAAYDASRSDQSLGATFPYTEFPLLNEALSSGELIVIPDTQLDTRWARPGSGETDIRTWIGAPLVASDTIIGLLTIGSDKPHAFSTHDREAIRAFAQQAALAVRNAIIIVELDKNLTELREAQARLMRVARLSAAGETAAGVAHQINNPLGAIIGQAHMLLADLPLDSQAYQAVEIIRRAAYRAGNIVQRMLDLTRKRAYDFHPVDINQSVQDAVMLIKAQIEPHIAKLNVRLAPELPLIKGSREHLEDVWLNLLLNARDAIIDSEHGEINMMTGVNAEGDRIEVVVEDNGKGISSDDMERLFQPFFTTKDHGIGLGLSICQDMIDQHGGTIQVESKVGEGTTITVSLPVEKA